MKKTLVTALTIIAFITVSHAQRFQIGVKGGMNVSNFIGGNFEDMKNSALVSYHAGGLINFKLGRTFSIQPELLFSSQGAKLKNNNTGITEDLKLNYLSLPVMLKLKSNTGFYIETGPVFSLNVSGQDFEDQSVKDVTESTDFSWAAGLGFHSKIGLGIGARYNVGISKVNDASFEAAQNTDLKNGVLQVSLFFTLF